MVGTSNFKTINVFDFSRDVGIEGVGLGAQSFFFQITIDTDTELSWVSKIRLAARKNIARSIFQPDFHEINIF